MKDAERLLLEFAPEAPPLEIEGLEDNRPLTRARLRDLESLAETTFDLASRHLSEEDIMALRTRMAKAAEFMDQMRVILNHGMAATMIGIGHRVGLFDAMASFDGAGAPTHEIAQRSADDLAAVAERRFN